MGAAAAILILKEKEIVRAFRAAGATSATKAVSTSDLRVDERTPFKLLRRHGAVVETTPGLFYLDVAAWDRVTRRRQRTVSVVLLLVMVISAVAAYMSAGPR